MERGRSDERINMLLHVDNFFGEHKSRLGPTLKFLIAIAAPILLYIMVLCAFMKFSWFLVFEIPWAICMALRIIGRGPEKLERFKKKLKNKYATASELANVTELLDDGIIERPNGTIAYLISGYFMTYVNDVVATIDMQTFLHEMRGLDYDIYCHQVTDEVLLQNKLEVMKVYTDKELMQERMELYIDQDEYCSGNSSLYRIIFLVKGYKEEWRTLRAKLEKVVASDAADVFKDCHICEAKEANDIMSRDICTNIDLQQMLVSKYANEQYFGSQVLYYDDKIPEEFKPKVEGCKLEERRVVLKEGEEVDDREG